uniref:Uncharacterized protein n=1 Tax=Anser brachyrhynchus TaxID=132585 RepID=A0A8B9BWW3_9AVES
INCLFKILLFCRREGFVLLVEHLLYVHPAFDITCSARRRREGPWVSFSFAIPASERGCPDGRRCRVPVSCKADSGRQRGAGRQEGRRGAAAPISPPLRL